MSSTATYAPSAPPDSTSAPGGISGSSFNSARTLWIAALVCALLAAGIAFTVLNKSTQTTTYYVLNTAVAARAPITTADLQPITTSAGGQPPNALSYDSIASGQVFAKTALQPGDVVSASVAGALQPVQFGLPPNYTVASITVDADAAEAGLITRGDYVDVYDSPGSTGRASSNSGDQGAFLVLHHVLVVAVEVDPASITQATGDQATDATEPGPASSQVTGGIPSMYLLAVTPDNAAKVALLEQNKSTLYMTWTPQDSANSPLRSTASLFTMLGQASSGVPNGGAGTDNVLQNQANPSPSPSTAGQPATGTTSSGSTSQSPTTSP